MQRTSQLAPGPIYQPGKPVRNPQYKRFVKGFPCIGCGATRDIDPMHSGPHALGTKGCDLKCLPGCRQCHREFDADPRGFAERYQLDIEQLIATFNRVWESRQRKTA